MMQLSIIGNGYTAQYLSKEALKKGIQVSIITRNISNPKKKNQYYNYYESKNIAENLYKDPEIKTCSTFEETFKQAYNDSSYKIVIPIENSLAGRVADIHYLLPKYKLQIHGEHFQAVEHNLLCKPDATISDIKFVVLGLCLFYSVCWVRVLSVV